jgi:hypothetical protein
MMTYEEWKEKYNPVLDETAEPRLFETYGSDLQVIALVPENFVWTLQEDGIVDAYNCTTEFLAAGKRIVNRIGYVLTNRCWERKDLTAEW